MNFILQNWKIRNAGTEHTKDIQTTQLPKINIGVEKQNRFDSREVFWLAETKKIMLQLPSP